MVIEILLLWLFMRNLCKIKQIMSSRRLIIYLVYSVLHIVARVLHLQMKKIVQNGKSHCMDKMLYVYVPSSYHMDIWSLQVVEY